MSIQAIQDAVSLATRGQHSQSMKMLAELSKDAEKLDNDALQELAVGMHTAGIYAEAIRLFELLASRTVISTDIVARLFDCAHKCGDSTRAYHWGARACCVNPSHITVLNNLGIACLGANDRPQARTWLLRALAVQPNNPSILNNTALTDRTLGDYSKAVGRMMKAKDDVSSDNMIKNMANLLYYVPDVPVSVIDGVHREWYRRFGANRRGMIRRLPYLLDPNKKLRIGLFSSDWRNHPVGRNFLPVFKAVDRNKIDFVVFHQHGLKDDISREYEAGSKKFISTLAYAQQSTAQLIANENCDIAIYFAGRFDDNRPMVAAYKPAPVQVSYLDAGRLAIPEIDYLIVGRKAAPHDLPEMGTERILGIPRFYQHEPITPSPLTHPPFTERGFFCFGSYNSPVKLNDIVFQAWDKILKACPRSMMYFRYRQEFGHADLVKRVLDNLPNHRDRIILDTGTVDHLKQTQHIDLHLDSFPFCASTTSFELAWMGVPTLSVTGGTIMSNYGAMINDQIGLPNEFLAHSLDEYVQKAIYLYNNPECLIDIRKSLRDTVFEKMCKPNNKYFERWMRAIWRRHCKLGGADGAIG